MNWRIEFHSLHNEKTGHYDWRQITDWKIEASTQ